MEYSIELWDHELGRDGGFSAELALEHLDGPNVVCGAAELRAAVRKLRANCWGWPSIFVSVMDEQPAA